MLVELNYIFLNLLLIIFSILRYYRHKERSQLYFSIGFIFLTLSTVLQAFSSAWWSYIDQLGIPYRFIELTGLALFACFTITTILALRKASKT